MKQLLRGSLALVVILGLTLAAVWLVRSAPTSLRAPLHQATITSHPSQPTPGETSPPTSQSSSPNQIAPTVTLVAQPAPEPTATPTFEPTFDSLKVVSVEEITAPVGLSVDWSPDGQKALVAREITTQHILTGVQGGEYWTAVNLVDLWVWHQQTIGEIEVTNQALTWDWSPDSEAVVYVTPTNAEGFDGELRVFNLNNQTTETVVKTDIIQAYPGPFWLSSDEIVYPDEAQFWIMRPDGSEHQLLNNLQMYRQEAEEAGKTEYAYSPDKLAGRLQLSPNETRMAYETLSEDTYGSHQLWLSDLDGNNRTAIGTHAVFQTWSADGTFLLYVKSPSDDNLTLRNLWQVNSDGSNPRLLLDAMQWGATIDYVDSEVEDRPGIITFVTLSPDNKFVVFSEYEEGGLWLLELASRRWRNLSQDEILGNVYSINWPTKNRLNVSTGSVPNLKYFQLTLGE